MPTFDDYLKQQGVDPAKQPVPNKPSLADNVGTFAKGALDGVVDAGVSAGRGVASAIDETFDTAGELGFMGGEAIRDALPEDARIATQKFLSPAAQAFRNAGLVGKKGEFGYNVDDGLTALGVQQGDQTVAGSVVGDISQFVAGFIGVSRLAKGFGLPATTTAKGAFAVGTAKGAVTDFAVFDPTEERLANLAKSVGIPYAELLTFNPGDSQLEGRFKQAFEGAIAGAALEGLWYAAKGSLYLKRYFTSGNPADLKQAEKAQKIAEEAADAAANDLPYTPPSPIGPLSETPYGDMLEIMDSALLTDELQDVMTGFTSVPAKFDPRGPDATELLGDGMTMINAPLEDAFSAAPSGDGTVLRDMITEAGEPIREIFRKNYGPKITLYRGQRSPAKIQQGLKKNGMEESTQRNVLSWSTDPQSALKFAFDFSPPQLTYDVGVTPSEAKRMVMESQLRKPGEEFLGVGRGNRVTVNPDGSFTVKTWREPPDGVHAEYREGVKIEVGKDGTYVDPNTGDIVYDPRAKSKDQDPYYEVVLPKGENSVLDFFLSMQDKHFRGGYGGKQFEEQILRAEVDVDDIIWVTDREGASEIVLRNGNSVTVDGTGKLIDENGTTRVSLSNDEMAELDLYSQPNIYKRPPAPKTTMPVAQSGGGGGKLPPPGDPPGGVGGDGEFPVGPRREEGGAGGGNTPEPPRIRTLRDLLDPAQADNIIRRLIENLVRGDAGDFSFREGYDPINDINLNRIGDERGVVELAEALGEFADGAFGIYRGAEVETWASIRPRGLQVARDFAIGSPEQLAANLAKVGVDGQNLSATLNGLKVMAQSARKNVLRNIEAHKATQTPQTLEQLFNSIQTLAHMQGAVKGYSSNLGRALNSAKMVAREANDISKALASLDDPRLIHALDPTGQSTTAGNALNALMGRLGATGGNAGRMSRVMEPTLWNRVQRVAETWYTSSIMSAPGTLAVNLGGGLQQNLLQPLERALGGLTVGNREIAREGMDQLYYTWSSTFEALRIAGRAWRANSPILEGFSGRGTTILGDIDGGGISAQDLAIRSDTTVGRFMNGMDAVTGFTFRNILFTDELVRQMAFMGRQRAQFARQGRNGNLSGQQLADFIDTQMDTVYVDGAATRGTNGEILAEEAASTARSAVFQQPIDYGSFSYHTERVIRAIPGSRIIAAPFIRTPINILKSAIRRTPALRHVMEDVRADLRSPDPSVRAVAEGRMVMGSAMYGTFMMLAYGGFATGAGYKNAKSRTYRDEMGGWSPFSLVDPKTGKHYSISRSDPIASHIQVAATLAEMTKLAILDGEEDPTIMELAGEGADILFTSVVASLRDKTYLTSLADLMALVDNPNEDETTKGIEKFAGDKLGGFVPSIVAGATLDLSEDPVKRATNTWLDKVKKRLPVLAEEVDVAYDLFGRPVEGDRGWPLNVANVSRVSRERTDIGDEMGRLLDMNEVVKTKLPRSKDGIDLAKIRSKDPKQSAHARWGQLVGTVEIDGVTLPQIVEALIDSDDYKYALSDGQPGLASLGKYVLL